MNANDKKNTALMEVFTAICHRLDFPKDNIAFLLSIFTTEELREILEWLGTETNKRGRLLEDYEFSKKVCDLAVERHGQRINEEKEVNITEDKITYEKHNLKKDKGMVYLKKFKLMTRKEEEGFLLNFSRTCFDSYYPLRLFPYEKELDNLEFSNITIFCGGNGSGKSTLLNIIAEKLHLERNTLYNRTYFFEPYLENCHFELGVYDNDELLSFKKNSRIISSDDVFNHIIEVREQNEKKGFKRQLIFDEKRNFEKTGIWNGPRGFDADDPDSLKAYTDYYKFTRQSASKYVKENVGYDERTYSNGENGFKYFTDAIQPNGLYLLDEPENSLSAEMQLNLVQFILGMARFYNCQFILSTHSPFILSLPFAKIYNLDAEPVKTCKWTDIESVKVFQRFFKDHEDEFSD